MKVCVDIIIKFKVWYFVSVEKKIINICNTLHVLFVLKDVSYTAQNKGMWVLTMKAIIASQTIQPEIKRFVLIENFECKS